LGGLAHSDSAFCQITLGFVVVIITVIGGVVVVVDVRW